MAYKCTFNPKNPIKYVGNPNNIIWRSGETCSVIDILIYKLY